MICLQVIDLHVTYIALKKGVLNHKTSKLVLCCLKAQPINPILHE